MKTSATNRKIRLLLTALNDGALVPRPEFQRRLVWTNKHKQEFIRTVLINYPFPEIYIAAGDVNPDTGKGIEMLVDGQQRVTTLHQYFTGSEDLRLGEIRPYQSLTKDEKIEFLEYEVVVRDLGRKSIEEIKEVFTRINSTKYSLNAMEIHNARFDGAFKHFGEKLSEHEFFEKNRVFKTNDVRRMGDLVFTLTLAITVMTTYFNRDDELETFLEQYNDDFPASETLNAEFYEVFRFVNACKFEAGSRLWRKAELFNVLVELHRALVKEGIALNATDIGARISAFFERVGRVATHQSDIDDVTTYYKASIQATNDRSSRIRRGHVIAKILRDELDERPADNIGN